MKQQGVARSPTGAQLPACAHSTVTEALWNQENSHVQVRMYFLNQLVRSNITSQNWNLKLPSLSKTWMLDQLIVCHVVEGQQQHTLLLQVGLVDPRDDKIEFCLKHSWATNAYFQPQGCSPSKWLDNDCRDVVSGALAAVSLSASGSKSRLPAMVRATAISGLFTKLSETKKILFQRFLSVNSHVQVVSQLLLLHILYHWCCKKTSTS